MTNSGSSTDFEAYLDGVREVYLRIGAVMEMSKAGTITRQEAIDRIQRIYDENGIGESRECAKFSTDENSVDK